MAEQKKNLTAGQAVVAVIAVVGAGAYFGLSASSTKPDTPSKTAAARAPSPEDQKAEADRRFTREAEVHAQMHVHEALIKARGAAMPDKWAERGEMIRRDGDFALVLVRTGIKEGMLSPLINVQSYLVSVRMNMPGDKVLLSAAQRCTDPPDAGVVAMMMVKNGWPSVADAVEHMRKTIDASAKASKPRRAAAVAE